jgi:hypothetical protein
VNDRHGKLAKRKSRRKTNRRSDGSQNNASKTKPSPWLAVEDVFQRWRDRLGSSEDAKDELYALLCDRETRSAIQHTSASGEITRDIQNAEFWRDRLGLDTDADGVDHLRVAYSPYVHEDYSLFGGSTEFVVRRSDVDRRERLYFPMTAAPPVATAPPPRAVKGPLRGEIDRYGDADRALYPEIERIMKSQQLSPTEAVRQIPEGKIAGRGTLDSRVRRVSHRFRRENP